MDEQVKERMVGAAVLVLVGVVFIPMILAGPAEDPDTGRSATPGEQHQSSDPTASSGQSGFASKIVPLDEANPAPTAAQQRALDKARERVREARATPGVVALAPQPKAPPATPQTTTPKAKSKAKPQRTPQRKPQADSRGKAEAKSATSAKSKPQSAPAQTTAASSAQGWVVQLGSFASARNAHALRDRLRAKGYKVFARSSGQGSEAVTRVYVGPDATRERAQRRVDQLLGETQLKGIVIRAPA